MTFKEKKKITLYTLTLSTFHKELKNLKKKKFLEKKNYLVSQLFQIGHQASNRAETPGSGHHPPCLDKFRGTLNKKYQRTKNSLHAGRRSTIE